MPQTKIAAVLSGSDSFLAHIHLSPDPDTIGSVLALKLAFESEGKVMRVFCEDPLIPSAKFLPGFDSVEQLSLANALTYSHQVYLCVDTAKWELAAKRPKQEFHSPIVVIDHHPDNDIKSRLRWVDPKASSVALLVFQLLGLMKLKITPDIANCLLFGLLGDTGLFQNTNTKMADFVFAGKLIKFGADYHELVKHLVRSYELDELSCWAKVLKNLKLSADRSYAWMTVSYQDCADVKGEPKLGVIANQFAGRINGTKFGAILAEKERGVTKGSLRSRELDFDVSAIAHRLGGGGHKNAASFKLNLPLAAAEKKLLEAADYVTNKS